MALVELGAGSALDGAIQIFIQYDTETLVCNRLRWINTSGRNAEVRIGTIRVLVPSANSATRALAPGALNLVPAGEEGDTFLIYEPPINFGSA